MPALTGSGPEECNEANARSDLAALSDAISLSAQIEP
jgi:hypothetical protein